MQTPRCIKGRTAIRVCVSQNCEHPNPFICSNCFNNACKQLHKECNTQDWHNFKNNMEGSKKPINPNLGKIALIVEQATLKSIKQLQNQFQYFELWRSNYGMPQEGLNLLQSIQNNQESKFTGKRIAEILNSGKYQKQIDNFNEAKIKKQVKEVLGKIKQIQKTIREMYLGENTKQETEIVNDKGPEYKQVKAPETKIKVPESKIKTPQPKIKNPQTKVKIEQPKIQQPKSKVPEEKIEQPMLGLIQLLQKNKEYMK